MEILELFFYLQSINTVLAVVLNLFLVYLVARFTKNKIGAYKWIIIYYALFEAVYAVIILAGMPVHYVADGSWLVFNHGGLIGNTPFAFLGPSLYCTFYEIWIGFIVLHFIYRYIVVCKQDFVMKVVHERNWKLFVAIAFVSFLAFTCFCGMFLCTRQVISEPLAKKVINEFHLDPNVELGYILLRHKSSSGTVSLFGTATIFNHYLLVSSSSIIIFYCTYKIHKAISCMQPGIREVRVERQMFFSLIIQTAVPVIFCHIPSVVYLSFPFLEYQFSFGVTSLIFTWTTTVNKVVDPIIVILCIKEYRKAACSLLSKRGAQIGVSSTGSGHLQTQSVYTMKHETVHSERSQN